MSGFGQGFKKAREARGISIDAVASETRIGARFLRAIEDEEFEILPGGLFNRGFIRAYAERVGLDPDQAVEDYQRLVREIETQEPEPASYRPGRQSAPNWALIVGVAALVIAVLAYVLFFRDSPPVNPAAPRSGDRTKLPSVIPNLAPAPPKLVEIPSVPAPEPPAPEPKAPEPPAPIKAPLDVELRVTETSWVQVTADGAATDMGEFQPGTTRRYSAQKSIEMRVGNAGGLSLKVNDREISSLGKHGEVRQFTITPDNAAKLGATPGN